MNVEIVILAAGQGTRMRSAIPKVLHPIAGKPMLQHVIDASGNLSVKIHVVIGHGADEVQKQISSHEINWVVQEQQLGTGHAVQQAMPWIAAESIVLVLYGDVPLIGIETLKQLIDQVGEKTLALLTVELTDATGYGRIVRDNQNQVTAIVEHKDATPEQLTIKEVNTGILAVKASVLREGLPLLSNTNSQAEFYLTDIIAIAKQHGCSISTQKPRHTEEVQGVNNKKQLAELERWFQKEQAAKLMDEGVTFFDPNRFDCRGNLSVGKDVVIDINVVVEGRVSLGNNVTIGPNCLLSNTTIGNDVEVLANSVIDRAIIGNECSIGPFARIRPGTHLADKVKVGNFVETKKANIGVGSKVNHLTYIGDSEIGSGTNIGAGTITCNYDGVNKFKTTIGDNVFIGSNTSLVAPVTIENESTVGAGSTITRNVGAKELAVARGKQRNIEGWQRPVKKNS